MIKARTESVHRNASIIDDRIDSGAMRLFEKIGKTLDALGVRDIELMILNVNLSTVFA